MISKPLNMIALLFLTCCFVLPTFAQQTFPSRDSKEWNDLTVAERWQAVNIPEEQLKNMPTDDLIEHCVNFDFMWDIFNYPNYGIGLNVIIENHNGLRELLNRKDAGKLLLDYYKKIDLNKVIKKSKPVDRGVFVAKVFFLELFLSHPNILNQFQGSEKKLLKAIIKTHDACLDINNRTRKDIYCGYSIRTKALAIGRALERFKGAKSHDPAMAEMDLSKLSDENYKKIIKEAREF